MSNEPARSNWFKEGERVVRKDTEEAGTIVESGRNQTKVKWDGGRTSYFRRGQFGNFRTTEIIECGHDQEATEKARQFIDGQDIELWDGSRLIVRFPRSK